MIATISTTLNAPADRVARLFAQVFYRWRQYRWGRMLADFHS